MMTFSLANGCMPSPAHPDAHFPSKNCIRKNKVVRLSQNSSDGRWHFVFICFQSNTMTEVMNEGEDMAKTRGML
ncbi:MAG: hypothetical protein DMG57_41145 [Acidobacteria bacterium]|nr:MAG: hypothetical protein DMG57_41145 [Acidobacteriota bacterium]